MTKQQIITRLQQAINQVEAMSPSKVLDQEVFAGVDTGGYSDEGMSIEDFTIDMHQEVDGAISMEIYLEKKIRRTDGIID